MKFFLCTFLFASFVLAPSLRAQDAPSRLGKGPPTDIPIEPTPLAENKRDPGSHAATARTCFDSRCYPDGRGFLISNADCYAQPPKKKS